MNARKCAGCGQRTGAIFAINRGYWHIACFKSATDEQKDAPALARQRKHEGK